jgi:hypothetical protein
MRRTFVMAILTAGSMLGAGCETVRDQGTRPPTAAEVAALNEIQPLRQRLDAVERQVADKVDRAQIDEAAQQIEKQVGERVSQGETSSQQSLAELRAQLAVLRQRLESQSSSLGALEERVGSTERLARDTQERVRAQPKGQPGADARAMQNRLRTEMLLMQVKMEVASASGVNLAQIDHVDVAGFGPGSADLPPVLAASARTRDQLETVKGLVAEGRVEIIKIIAFEDVSRCRRPEDQACNTVGLRRGINTANYLDAPRGTIDAREPTERWGAPADNRRVVVFYVRKGASRAVPALPARISPSSRTSSPTSPLRPPPPPARSR